MSLKNKWFSIIYIINIIIIIIIIIVIIIIIIIIIISIIIFESLQVIGRKRATIELGRHFIITLIK